MDKITNSCMQVGVGIKYTELKSLKKGTFLR